MARLRYNFQDKHILDPSRQEDHQFLFVTSSRSFQVTLSVAVVLQHEEHLLDAISGLNSSIVPIYLIDCVGLNLPFTEFFLLDVIAMAIYRKKNSVNGKASLA